MNRSDSRATTPVPVRFADGFVELKLAERLSSIVERKI